MHDIAAQALRFVDPETAHRAAISGLKLGLGPRARADRWTRLKTKFAGLDLPNPIGLAAGFDKNCEAPDAMLAAGFGFVECGTVTPRPQEGNPRPRIFRLGPDRAVINRLGFNNEGLDAFADRLDGRAHRGGVVGVNVGANKDSSDRIGDYVLCMGRVWRHASYVTANISSPNTPGLRELQQAKVFDDLLARVMDARARMSREAGTTPVLIKIAPDLSLNELDDLVGGARRHRVDGMIVGNTTVSRPSSLRDQALAREAGGLSGRPLFPLATRMLAEAYVRAEGAFPLVGAGGIDSGQTALAKIRAGASLIQLYSALVFHGIRLIAEVRSALSAEMDRGGFAHLDDLVGVDAAAMTAEPWPES